MSNAERLLFYWALLLALALVIHGPPAWWRWRRRRYRVTWRKGGIRSDRSGRMLPPPPSSDI